MLHKAKRGFTQKEKVQPKCNKSTLREKREKKKHLMCDREKKRKRKRKRSKRV